MAKDDNNYQIRNKDLASALYAGTQDVPETKSEMIADAIVKGLTHVFSKAKESIFGQWWSDFCTSVEMFKNNPREFFDGWVADSPVGAAAGTLAVGLSGGLLVVVGGTALGLVGKVGISAMSRMTSLGRIITSGAAGVGGWLLNAGNLVKAGWGILTTWFAGWTIGQLIRFGVSSSSFLFNFNWNISDKQIEAQQKSLLTNIYRQLGATIGATVGTLVCGTLPAELINKNAQKLKVDPQAIAEIKYISLHTPDFEYGEIYDEMFDSLKALLTVTQQAAVQAIFLETYKNFRRVVKWLAKVTFFEKIPGLGEAIKKWGEEGSQSWSFASALEDAIESIDDTNLKEFTEELIEEFMEVCSENLMIIAGATG